MAAGRKVCEKNQVVSFRKLWYDRQKKVQVVAEMELKKRFSHHMKPSGRDLLVTLFVLVGATCIGTLFWSLGFTEANIITVYILGVLLTSLFTKRHFCSVLSSLASVLLFNFFFTEPRLTFHAYEHGYPFTFAIMLTAALITGTLANKLKSHAKQSAQAAFRTQILFDTNRLLQKAEDENDMINITASQLMKLLNRDIIAYPERDGRLCKACLFHGEDEKPVENLLSGREREAVEWVFQNRECAGATRDHFPEAENLYFALCSNQKAYGVMGIHMGSLWSSLKTAWFWPYLANARWPSKTFAMRRKKKKPPCLHKRNSYGQICSGQSPMTCVRRLPPYPGMPAICFLITKNWMKRQKCRCFRIFMMMHNG